MDTKWKKSKTIAGLASFVLGIWMLAGCAVMNPLLVLGNSADLSALVHLNGSYEETEAFRDEIAYSLNQLIAIATQKNQICFFGDSAYSYEGVRWGFPGHSLTAADVVVTAVITESVEEGTAFASDSVLEDLAAEWITGEGKDSGGESSLLTRDQTEELKKNLEAEYGGNQNLLFELKKDGEVIFDNLKGQTLAASADSLPEGYDFLLIFDGEEVKIRQDGAEADIYGDGMYETDGKHWSLPGYANYQLPQEWKECQVVMAARKTPVRTMENGTFQGGALYHIYTRYREARDYFAGWCARLVLGCLVLLISGIWKRERQKAQERLGELLGKAVLEIRLLLLALWLYLMWIPLVYLIVGNGGYWYGRFDSFRLIADGISALGTVGVYLIAVRLRYGGKLWKNSLIGRLCRRLSGQVWKLDVQKRIAGRVYRPVCFLTAGAGLLGIGLLDENYMGLGIAGYLVGASLAAFFIALLLLFYNEYRQWKLAAELGLLSDQIDAAYRRTERENEELPADSDLVQMAEKVAKIRDGLEEAVEERMKSERMKVELVANVSHDIKTPLTSIISYVDLLKEEENLPEELKDYVAILARKSERLKEMVQDVFEVSKAASGQLPVQKESLDLVKLLRQTLADMQEQIAAAPVSLKVQLPEDSVEIRADGQRLYRVFQNLFQNALQYSLEGSRIYVKLEKQGSLAVASVRNTSKCELDGGVDFTERFVRGDKSRTDGGSGLGLSIAKSFTEACGGTFRIETIADLFVATVEFGIEEDPAA